MKKVFFLLAMMASLILTLYAEGLGFPDAIYLKTRTQSFNGYCSFMVSDGRIYSKPISAKNEKWALFEKTGIPFSDSFTSPDSVLEISADADELVALCNDGRYYFILFLPAIGSRAMTWYDIHGFPKKGRLAQNDLVRNNRAWSLAKRQKEVLWYEDRFGSQHHFGTIGLESYYFLDADGQNIRFNDNGLPNDFSHSILGPERGAFIAESLSASASTIFLINKTGEMYTRLVDYDTIGCDSMLFRYTYAPPGPKEILPGDNPLSALTPWGLPAEGWRKQPAIERSGLARISSVITILQNGRGNEARELRVAGLSPEGRAGYYCKNIFEDSWKFEEAPIELADGDYLPVQAFNTGVRGKAQELSYAGQMWINNKQEETVTVSVGDFPITEGSCHITVSRNGETATIQVHPVEAWSPLVRYNPGLDGTPKGLLMTIDIHPQDYTNISPDFRQFLEKRFFSYDKKAMASKAEITKDYFYWNLPNTENGEWTNVFLFREGINAERVIALPFSDEALSRNPVLEQYEPAALSVPQFSGTEPDQAAVIAQRIEINEALKKTLRAEKDAIQTFRVTLGFSRISYSFLDGLASTPVAKAIQPINGTMPLQNEKLAIVRSTHPFSLLSESRMELLDMLIDEVDTRLDILKDMQKKLTNGEVLVNSEDYPVNIKEFFARASLPEKTSGVLYPDGKDPVNASFRIASDIYPVCIIETDEPEGYRFAFEAKDTARTIRELKGG